MESNISQDCFCFNPGTMRFESLLRVQKVVPNRFELCRLMVLRTRKFHFLSTGTRDAINETIAVMAEEVDSGLLRGMSPSQAGGG